MKFSGLFKQPTYRHFKYYPQYYREDRESLMSRIREVKNRRKDDKDIEKVKGRISRELKRKRIGRMNSSDYQSLINFRRKQARKYNRTILYTIIAVTLLILIVFL